MKMEYNVSESQGLIISNKMKTIQLNRIKFWNSKNCITLFIITWVVLPLSGIDAKSWRIYENKTVSNYQQHSITGYVFIRDSSKPEKYFGIINFPRKQNICQVMQFARIEFW